MDFFLLCKSSCQDFMHTLVKKWIYSSNKLEHKVTCKSQNGSYKSHHSKSQDAPFSHQRDRSYGIKIVSYTKFQLKSILKGLLTRPLRPQCKGSDLLQGVTPQTVLFFFPSQDNLSSFNFLPLTNQNSPTTTYNYNIVMCHTWQTIFIY